MTKRGELYFIGGLLSSTLISGLILSSSTVSAETYTKSALIRVQAACTLDGTATTVHSATIAGGTYREGIGESIISASCNDAGGFGVYAIGFTGDTDGNNTLAHNADSSISIATGTATSGNTSNWAMKLEAYENGNNTPTIENGYDSYSVVPNDYVLVASYPNATSATDDVIFRTYYSAFITMTQRAGTYTGKVKYVMVHPSTGPAPEKECLDFECAAGDSPDYPDPSDPTKRYYAMQNIQTICPKVKTPISSNDNPPSIKLIDLRDNRLYNVAKLSDGRCWTLDDFALNLLDSDVQTAMTTHDWTNASQTSLGYLFNGGGSRESKYASSPVEAFSTNQSDYSTSAYENAGYFTPRVHVAAIGSSAIDQTSQQNGWKIGAYYDACAAFAGAYCYSDSESGPGDPVEIDTGWPGSDENDMDSLDVVEDICPTGWRIPTTGSYYTQGSSYYGQQAHQNEYRTLYYIYGNGSKFRNLLHLPLSGWFSYAGIYNNNNYQHTHSSTMASRYNVNYAYFYPNSYTDMDSGQRYNGLTIRCISK